MTTQAGGNSSFELIAGLIHSLSPRQHNEIVRINCEAQQRAAALLGGQAKVKQQAYTLAYQDGFIVIAVACVVIIILVAFMKHMNIMFNSSSAEPPG